MPVSFEFKNINNPQIQLSDIQDFLKSSSKFNLELCGINTVNFNPDNNLNYCKLIRITQNGKINSSALEEITGCFKKDESSYPWNLNLSFDDINSFNTILNQRKELKDKLYIIAKALFYSSNDQLKNTIPNQIFPAFNSLFEYSDIWFLQLDLGLLNHRLAAMRALYSLDSLPKIFELPKDKFPGFKSFESLEPSFYLGVSLFLDPFFTLIPSYMSGWSEDRMGGSFILLFGKLEKYLPYFPWRLQDLSCSTNYFSWHSDDRTSLSYRKSLFEDITFNKEDIYSLLEDYVTGLNKLFVYLLDPCNFADMQNKLDTARWFGTYQTISRIANETNIIQTETTNNYIRKILTWGIVDKLAEMISKHPSKDGMRANDIFKNLFKRATLDQINQIVSSEYRSPLNDFFRKRYSQAIDDLYKTVLDGIFIPQYKQNNSVTVPTKNGLNEVYNSDEYVTTFIRELRNTHHGYLINKPEVLFINKCNLTDKMPLLASCVWLALLQAPKKIIEGDLALE